MARPPEPGLHRKLVWVTFFRLVTVTVLLGGTAVAEWNAASGLEAGTSPLYGVVAATYAVSLIFAWLLHRRRLLLPLAYAQILVDVAVAVVVVAVTGRAESVFVFLFSLAVVNGAILVERRGAVTAVVLALLGYVPLVLWGGAPFPWRSLWIHAGAFAATAVLATYLAEQLRRTGERLAEREGDLAAVTALHESIVQSVTSGLLTLDPAGRVTFLNRAGEQLTGVKRSELVGRPASGSFAVFRTGTARGETDFENARGERLRIGYSSFPLTGGGAPRGTAVIFQDLTALRVMEERVAQAERQADLGRLSAGLAHELRNPLASMLGAVELLGDTAALDADDRQLLGIVLREGGRLANLVADFLAYARPATARREPVELATLAAETLDAFGHDPAAAGMALERSLRPAPVRGDPDQLRQVLWNLLVNAAQALPPAEEGRRGRIRVACAATPEGGAELTVEDDGPGVGRDDRERIFTPFFTTRADGTGLGLATVQRIVDAHGGSASVEEAAPHGARFRIWLPAPTPAESR